MVGYLMEDDMKANAYDVSNKEQTRHTGTYKHKSKIKKKRKPKERKKKKIKKTAVRAFR